MGNKILNWILVVVCIMTTVTYAIYVPVVWLAISTLAVLWVIAFYLYVQLKRRISEEFLKYNNRFAESGNAITDTLKIAFDQLKKNNTDHNKINSKLTEYSSKIHRLEQIHNRTYRDKDIGIKINEDINNENEQRRNKNG